MNLEKTSWGPWPNCLRLFNAELEMIITTDVGPRIISIRRPADGANLFWVDPATQIAPAPPDAWHPYGGHRFWHGPEIKPRTYIPDNAPVPYEWDGEVLSLIPATEAATGMQKRVEIRLAPHAPQVEIRHRLINNGLWEITAAPWALSMMAPGGVALIPQEPFVPFPEALLPARPMVLWPYTRMGDARFTWTDDYIAIRQDAAATAPIKVGVRNSPGWAAYVLGSTAFLKTAALQPDAVYPDFGSNWECYTDAAFLELETLGPLAPIAPGGGQVIHTEHWHLLALEPGGTTDDLYQQLVPVATEKVKLLR